ncbi:hypothetical protein GOZ78_01855 [Agrobacterium vitis]|uniref:hypothetical protein n=1 Tax=Agrobacterium vitis TaxID=373 RepID=UPI0012E889A9|nr:hypothetical protein [Agrobacterium vitis]MUZ81048.1 hypothetical protein [Agrobacterium vitis]MVA08766.1 hypothetical protein [Agrobacterium vitis]NSY12479.1 hypothetical protein [Agrobacterium vitis]NTA21612.1 hypothetical protein [Agrobacterium vitis]WEO73127.1 hypothetical protein G6L01_007370 [Agrobacterium vitis]
MSSASVKPSAAPGLYVVTNKPQAAAIDLFHCDLELVPAWARIVSDVSGIPAIPTDAKVINQWYGYGDLFEQIWREERQRRKFDMDYAAHVATLQAWHDKRWAVDAPATPTEPSPAPSAPVSSPSAASHPDQAAASSLPRKSRWS